MRVEPLGHLGVRLKERAAARSRSCRPPISSSQRGRRRDELTSRRRASSRPARRCASTIRPSQSTAAARLALSRSPGPVTSRTCSCARAPALAHDEVAQQARCACGGRSPAGPARDTRRATCSRASVGALGRQQAVGDRHDVVPRARRVEAADQRAVRRPCRTSTRACCGSATARRRGRCRRARSPRGGRSASARRAPARA